MTDWKPTHPTDLKQAPAAPKQPEPTPTLTIAPATSIPSTASLEQAPEQDHSLAMTDIKFKTKDEHITYLQTLLTQKQVAQSVVDSQAHGSKALIQAQDWQSTHTSNNIETPKTLIVDYDPTVHTLQPDALALGTCGIEVKPTATFFQESTVPVLNTATHPANAIAPPPSCIGDTLDQPKSTDPQAYMTGKFNEVLKPAPAFSERLKAIQDAFPQPQPDLLPRPSAPAPSPSVQGPPAPAPVVSTVSPAPPPVVPAIMNTAPSPKASTKKMSKVEKLTQGQA